MHQKDIIAIAVSRFLRPLTPVAHQCISGETSCVRGMHPEQFVRVLCTTIFVSGGAIFAPKHKVPVALTGNLQLPPCTPLQVEKGRG